MKHKVPNSNSIEYTLSQIHVEEQLCCWYRQYHTQNGNIASISTDTVKLQNQHDIDKSIDEPCTNVDSSW